LEELDMRWNDIGDDGMSLVADGLKLNSTLTKLDIRECGMTAEGMIIYPYTRYVILSHLIDQRKSLVYISHIYLIQMIPGLQLNINHALIFKCNLGMWRTSSVDDSL